MASLIGTADGTVYVRGPRGQRLAGETTVERARRFVAEGLATVVSPDTIQLFWLERDFRRYILERDRWTCQYCGRPGDTVDHRVPVSRGGLSTPANCVCACRECNQAKGDLTVEEFLALKERSGGS